MVKICKENDANIFIPACAPATEKLDAVVGNQLESSGIKVLHAPLDMFEKLNDKHQFCELMKSLNLAVPESFLVKSNDDVFKINEILKQRIQKDGSSMSYKHTFILKNIDYDPVHRLDLFTLPAGEKEIENYLEKITKDGNPIREDHPWTIQRFIDGPMWSTC